MLTKSARPEAMICSAVSGELIRPATPTGMSKSRAYGSAYGASRPRCHSPGWMIHCPDS